LLVSTKHHTFVPKLVPLSKKYAIIVWFWLFALLTSTIGVSVHAIYCYCTQKTTFTLFENVKCKNELNKADCCSKTVKSCCAKPEKSAPKKPCTKKTTKVFQLKTEFTCSDFNLQSFDFEAIDITTFKLAYLFSFPIVADAATYFNKAPPPLPLLGKFIRLNICSLLC
jgi:hypothetical protein